MKRLWASAFLLVVLFLGTLWNSQRVDQITADLSDTLNQAETAVSLGDWDTAEEKTLSALERWRQVENYFSIVLCHSHTDEVNTAFQQVLGFLRYRSSPEYDSANRTLIEQIEHLSEMEQLTWQNLL
jgi:hypothetical protein